MSQLDATLTRVPLTLTLTFDLEFTRSNCISRIEGPSQLDAALTGLPLTLNFLGQIVSREWEARLFWNERDRSR